MMRIFRNVAALAAFALATGTLTQAQNAESYYMQAARDSYRNGMKADAANWLDKELTQNPENGSAYALYGLLYDEVGDKGLAMRSYRKASVYLNPKKDKTEYSWVMLHMAQIFIDTDMPEWGQWSVDEALKSDDSYWPQIRLAAVLMLEGEKMDLDKALAIGKKAATKAKTNYERGAGYGIWAQALWIKDKKAEAYEVVMEGCEKCPESGIEALAARLAYNMGQYSKSATLACEIADKTNDSSTLNLLATGLSAVDYAATVAAVDSVFGKKAKSDKEVELLRKNFLFDIAVSGKHYEDIVKYRDAFPDEPIYMNSHLADTYNNIGAIGKAEEACDKWQKASKEDLMNDVSFLTIKSDICLSGGDIDGAIGMMGKAIAANPGRTYLRSAMGNLLIMTERYATAEAQADTAVLLAPNASYAASVKVRCMLLRGERERAKDFATAAMAREDSLVEVMNKPPRIATAINDVYWRDGVTCILCAAMGDKAAVDKYTQGFADSESGIYTENWSDAAIAYAILGDADKSLDALSKAIKAGYCGFTTIERTPELDIVRTKKPQEYAKLMSQAKEMMTQRLQRLETL